MNKKKYIIIFSSLIALIIVGAIYLISLDKDEEIIEETEVKEEVEIKEEVKVYEIKKKDDISKERQRFLDAIEAKADESAGGPQNSLSNLTKTNKKKKATTQENRKATKIESEKFKKFEKRKPM